jgi:hypothetical protein
VRAEHFPDSASVKWFAEPRTLARTTFVGNTPITFPCTDLWARNTSLWTQNLQPVVERRPRRTRVFTTQTGQCHEHFPRHSWSTTVPVQIFALIVPIRCSCVPPPISRKWLVQPEIFLCPRLSSRRCSCRPTDFPIVLKSFPRDIPMLPEMLCCLFWGRATILLERATCLASPPCFRRNILLLFENVLVFTNVFSSIPNVFLHTGIPQTIIVPCFCTTKHFPQTLWRNWTV